MNQEGKLGSSHVQSTAEPGHWNSTDYNTYWKRIQDMSQGKPRHPFHGLYMPGAVIDFGAFPNKMTLEETFEYLIDEINRDIVMNQEGKSGSSQVQNTAQSSRIRPLVAEDFEKEDKFGRWKSTDYNPYGMINENMNQGKPRSGWGQNPAQPVNVESFPAINWDAVHYSMSMSLEHVKLIESRKKNRGPLPKEVAEALERVHKETPYDPEIHAGLLQSRFCEICLKQGEHWTESCPYKKCVQGGTEIGPAASIFCFCHEKEHGHLGESDWFGHAVLKTCHICFKAGDHWPEMCPEKGKLPDPYSFDNLLEIFRAIPRTYNPYPL